MKIGGLQKFSLLDYPGHLAAIVFIEGCNFRCPFCYNPMLVWPRVSKLPYQKDRPQISKDDLFVFLKKRKGKLEAVVITGGEPTMSKDLPQLIKKIKDMGYLIKLDTNGTNPDMLALLIKNNLFDYVAMDIKASENKYSQATGVRADLSRIKKSIKILIDGNLAYEFRTTVVPGLIDKDDIKKMGEMIRGAEKWYIQQFQNNTELVDQSFKKTKPYSRKELKKMVDLGKKYVRQCFLR